jgi:hypothetical protein
LLEAAGDAETAGAGLVGGLQLGVRVSFAQTGHSPFQGVEVIGDGAQEADFAGRSGGRVGQSDRVFMDIEAEMEFTGAHGVVVSSHSVNESERLPRLRRGRSCGSAHLGNPRSE